MCRIFGDATLALCAKLSIFINPALLFFWRRICWTRQTYILHGTFDAAGFVEMCAGFGECNSFFFDVQIWHRIFFCWPTKITKYGKRK